MLHQERILLISLPHQLPESRFRLVIQAQPPVSLISAFSAVNQRHHIDLLDLHLTSDWLGSVESALKSTEYSLIAISVITFNYLHCIDMVRYIKSLHDVAIILGGVHAHVRPEETLKESGADYICWGNGAKTIDLLLRNRLRPNFSIPNLMWYENGRLQISKFELSEIGPIPYHLVDLSAYRNHWLPIVSSVGCPFSCAFCSHSNVRHKKVLFRQQEHIKSEIDFLSRHNINKFYISDDNFTLRGDRVLQIGKYLNKKARWRCNSRCDTLDEKMVIEMARLGCDRICFGVESGSQLILDVCRKGIQIGQIKRVFKWCRRVGIETEASFILGLPSEDKVTIQETLSLVDEIRPDICKFSPFIPLPGSHIYENIEKYDIEFIASDWYKKRSRLNYPIVRTSRFNTEDIVESMVKAYSVTRKAKSDGKVKTVDIETSILSIAAGIAVQRDINIPENKTILQALAETEETWRPSSPTDTIMLLGYKGMILELNLSGALIWEMMQQRTKLANAVTILSDIFCISEERAYRDVSAFLDSLIEKGLLIM